MRSRRWRTRTTSRLYFDKATFLADTGASSATGPLPDVGIILDADVDPPVSSYALGLGDLRPDPGQRQRVHRRDGHPHRAGLVPADTGQRHGVRLGALPGLDPGPGVLVRLRHRRAGRDDADFGGTPEESTYEFLLFNGTLHVGTVLFDGAKIPNDVETFIGVWSDKPFDRVVINDLSGSDDDEFLGEFYTGTTPNGCTMTLKVSYAAATLTIDVTLGTTIPRTWNLWIVHGKKAATRQHALAIPVLPVETRQVSIPLTPRGEVGILSTLQKAGEGVACSAFETVSTKP